MAYGHLLIGIAFTWTGFVLAISFMEAWLKFRAEGVTLPVGLSIGRLIFSALNKVEWFFALATLLLLLIGNGFENSPVLFVLAAMLVLLVQTIWLLPALNRRAALVVSGAEVPRSMLHFYYIGGELLKVTALLLFGFKLLQ